MPCKALLLLNPEIEDDNMEIEELVQIETDRRNAFAEAAALAARRAGMIVLAIVISYIDMLTSVGVGTEYLSEGYTTLGWAVIGIQVQEGGRCFRLR